MSPPLNPSPEDAKAAGKVTRFDICMNDNLFMREDADGHYVRYSDHAALIAQRDELVRAGKRLGVLAERICTDYAPTHRLLQQLDDARMAWDSALKSCAGKEGGDV